MDSDGVRGGYDLAQLRAVRVACNVPLVASGGAGELQHFAQAFGQADVDGALAASAFHAGDIAIPALKAYLHGQGIAVRRSEEHTSELQSLMRISYAVFCLK